MNETERLIRNITDAAVGLISGARHQPLLDAIDKAMSHAYAEGRADQAEESAKTDLRYQWLANRVLRSDYGDNETKGRFNGWVVRGDLRDGHAFIYGDSVDEAVDGKLCAMNETGQGEHGVTP